MAYILAGVCAGLVALLSYVTIKALGATKSVADARIAEAKAAQAQRQSASDLVQAKRIAEALNIQIADRDAEIAGFARRSLATLGDDPDAADVLLVLGWLQEQAGADATEADAGPVPDWLHSDTGVADDEG